MRTPRPSRPRLTAVFALLAASMTLAACGERASHPVAPEGSARLTTTSCAVGIVGSKIADPGETLTWSSGVTGCPSGLTLRWLYGSGNSAATASWTFVGSNSTSYTRTIGATEQSFYLKVRVFSTSTGTMLDESEVHPVLVGADCNPDMMC